jgi:SAM-dependent methyltransferase
MTSEPDALPFTGERFTPECVREIWYEHQHRYAFAAAHARGLRVLDAACGEGYGSALLAMAGAGQVHGIDIDPLSIDHAQRRYGHLAGLRFGQADVTALDHLPAASFDLIVSFETLEHVEAQERLLDGFARLLAPGGLLMVSTPDRRTYSDESGFRNEHHVRELYRPEFEALLRARFPAVRLLGQKLLFQSVLFDPDLPPRHAGACTFGTNGGLHAGLGYPPLYYLALCAADPATLPLPAASVHLFGDAAESVYTHYNDELRKHIRAGHLLAEQDVRLKALEAELAAARARIAELEEPSA